ncbi:Polygalacturonase 1 [Paramyrothecium foliicola]|nr:Polygalacturonase 1 [Paramyrothecium foliicola]
MYLHMLTSIIGHLACGALASQLESRQTCTFTDAASAINGKIQCSNIVLNNIVVPAGTTLDLTDLRDGTVVTFSGTTKFGYQEWEGPLISISGTRITLQGAANHLIDGEGARWWDGQGSGGGKFKPILFNLGLQDSEVKDLRIRNTPLRAIDTADSNILSFNNVNVDNAAGDAAGGRDTDAFQVGVGNSGLYFSGATVRTQGACINVQSGDNITFTGATCTGGTGLTVGPLNSVASTVSEVNFLNSRVINAQTGISIRTDQGEAGLIQQINVSGITLSGITQQGILISQASAIGVPLPVELPIISGSPFVGILVNTITGSVAASAERILILCGVATCLDFTFVGINFSGGRTSTRCQNVPSGVSC